MAIQPRPVAASGGSTATTKRCFLPATLPVALNSKEEGRSGTWLALGALIVLNALFRLPALLNAGGVHSDAAIVGLQAMHLLNGEFSPFLWGAGYQGSLDAAFVAAVFAVLGSTPLALMLAPFLGHLLLNAACFFTLRRTLSPLKAALATAPLVFTPQAINGVALYAPRQWAITFVFLAVWILASAGGAARRSWLLFLGTLLGVFSLYLDLFALQLMPALALFALACCLDAPRTGRLVVLRLGAVSGGALLGGLCVGLLRQSALASGQKALLAVDRIGENARLLLESALPWALGAKVFIPGDSLYPKLWEAPGLVRAFQFVGTASLLLFIALCAVWILWARVPWSLRKGALFALAATVSCLGGFLLSTMPVDMWSARYLAPILWSAPFALGPLAFLLRARGLAVILLPYSAVAALGGWLSFGPYVSGPLPRLDPRGSAQEERELGRVLRERGVHQAVAHYWLSYRLTFLFQEDPVVIPLSQGDDRYAPYRRAVEGAQKAAYIFHPSEPRATAASLEPVLRAAGGTLEHLEVAGFTVLLYSAASPGAP